MEQLLSRAFFETELPSLMRAFKAESGTEKVVAEVMLRSGQHIRMEHIPACTDTYIAIDRKDGSHQSRILVPYGAVLSVTLVAEADKKVGFVR